MQMVDIDLDIKKEAIVHCCSSRYKWSYELMFSTLAESLAGKTTLMISFLSKGIPYKDQTEELFVVMVSFHVFPTRAA